MNTFAVQTETFIMNLLKENQARTSDRQRKIQTNCQGVYLRLKTYAKDNLTEELVPDSEDSEVE